MAEEASSESDPTSSEVDFMSNILAPGSSMHPTFLLILDGAFAVLLFVLLGMAVLTKGNIHVLALIAIEGCLWASVKWFVNEFQKAQANLPPANKPEKNDEVKEE
ncbi:unnamed protein product [Somion occarium]|uniref:Uncharacterized protein n=1 Tax=Somion occarium TaxID=3059160 RepID=A0ABP1D2P0_9APHY